METYYREIPLEDGFALALLPKHSRLVGGKEVSLCKGFNLFSSISGKISCWNCGCTADRWIGTMNKKTNEFSKCVLNLFGTIDDRLVMMTRDHIIPKSLGGVDLNENLRPACADCNSARGSAMSEADQAFMDQNFHLVNSDIAHSRRRC